jgi:hypothetical protein
MGVERGLVLTVVIVHFKPSSKHEYGHISTFNIELGFILTEFHNFGESVFLQGVIKKRERDMKTTENIEL